MNEKELMEIIERIEVRMLWQDETLEALNNTVYRQEERIRLLQDELRHLFLKVNEGDTGISESSGHEVPPHY